MHSIDDIIRKELEAKRFVRTSELVKKTGLSRAYVQRKLHELKNRGAVVLVGKANRARYVIADKNAVKQARIQIRSIDKTIENRKVSEDIILSNIRKNTGIFADLPERTVSNLNYAFTEMLNNAIEHSDSDSIRIVMKREKDLVTFTIIDEGTGIFENIRSKFGLNSHLDAIQTLLKGKQTTMPEEHSGEGIFFTSKIADVMRIRSAKKQLIFNNLIEDFTIQDTQEISGTQVQCTIQVNTTRDMQAIFRQYTDESFAFNRTEVTVKLYQMGNEWVSRSQARRVVAGLERFDTVILDFRDLNSVGQGFADEIFRVWQNNHPDIEIIPKNTHENVLFMIKRAQRGG